MRIGVLILGLMLVGCTESSTSSSRRQRVPVQLEQSERVTGPDSPLSVYPDLDRVPINALDFVLSVEKPLALAPHQIHLVDAYGVEVPAAVRAIELDGELRSLRVRPEGLTVGARYILVIAGLQWRDGGALPTRKHSFFVLDADETPPSGRDVRVLGSPTSGTRNAVRVIFPEAMASSSLNAVTAVSGGKVAAGDWKLVDGGLVAQFVPTEPWEEGALVSVSLAAGLRDLAGNDLVDRPRGLLVPKVSLIDR